MKQLLTGHFNVNRRDHDSLCTGFGKHDRVLTTLPKGGKLYCRVDHKWGLGMPTDSEILDACRKRDGLRGRWKAVSHETYHARGADHTDVCFVSELPQFITQEAK